MFMCSAARVPLQPCSSVRLPVWTQVIHTCHVVKGKLSPACVHSTVVLQQSAAEELKNQQHRNVFCDITVTFDLSDLLIHPLVDV